jgi:hypothetical protein
MVSLNVETGEAQWSLPNVKRFLAASQERLYYVSLSQELTVVDRATGEAIGATPLSMSTFPIVNTSTDRVYLVGEAGSVQCLREVGKRWPTVRQAATTPPSQEAAASSPDAPASATPAAAPSAPPPAAPAVAPSDEDPFGDAFDDDPFAAGGAADEAPQDAADTGAGAADGAADEPATDDPFDPFGSAF